MRVRAAGGEWTRRAGWTRRARGTGRARGTRRTRRARPALDLPPHLPSASVVVILAEYRSSANHGGLVPRIEDDTREPARGNRVLSA